MSYYLANIESATKKNNYFRKVIYTTRTMQLVLMSLRPGEEIGSEVHPETTQFIRVESGKGKLILSGKVKRIKDGTAFIIPPNRRHNVVNTGRTPLKLYTLYSPPEHPRNRVEP